MSGSTVGPNKNCRELPFQDFTVAGTPGSPENFTLVHNGQLSDTWSVQTTVRDINTGEIYTPRVVSADANSMTFEADFTADIRVHYHTTSCIPGARPLVTLAAELVAGVRNELNYLGDAYFFTRLAR